MDAVATLPDARILHISDVHLGTPLPWLGEKGAAQRRQIRETFAALLRKAPADGVGLLLIAGDLFASPRPPRELAEFASSQVRGLAEAGVEAVICAGEADTPEGREPYAGGAFDGIPGVTVLPTAPRAVDFPRLGVSVTGRSGGRGLGMEGMRKLPRGQQPRTVGLLHVDPSRGGREALAHGVGETGFSYLALGGSHQTVDLATSPPAWFPGSPELIERSPQPGVALLIAFAGGQTIVSPLATAKRRYERTVLEPAAFPTQEALAVAIEARSDPDLILDVHVTGRAHPGQFLDIYALQERLATHFFALEIIDEAAPDLTLLPTAAGAGITVREKFLALMSQQLQEATTPADRRRIGSALRLGLWLLEERRVNTSEERRVSV